MTRQGVLSPPGSCATNSQQPKHHLSCRGPAVQVRRELTRGLNQRAVARAVKLALGPPTPAAAALPPPEQARVGQPSSDSLAGYLAS